MIAVRMTLQRERSKDRDKDSDGAIDEGKRRRMRAPEQVGNGGI